MMNRIDITPVKENYTQYTELMNVLNDRYKCNWEDSVHESYAKYIKQITDFDQELKDIFNKTEILEKEIADLNIGGLEQRSSELCAEADKL